MSGKDKIIDFKAEGRKRKGNDGHGDPVKTAKDKIRNLMAEAQKGKGRSRKTQTGAGKQLAPILNQSITGDGNTQIGGDLIVNSICPTFEEIKTIVDLVQEVAVLETTAQKNGISSPKDINLIPGDEDAMETVWKKFSEQFNLPGHKGLTLDKYVGALEYLMEWKTALENHLAQGPHGLKPA